MKTLFAFTLSLGCSVALFAGMPDISATAEGCYDVTLTTKRLTHSTKTVTKTFTTKKIRGEEVKAYTQFMEYCESQGIYIDEKGVPRGPAGFEVVYLKGDAKIDLRDPELVAVKKIEFKYTQFDFKTVKVYGVDEKGRTKWYGELETNYVTKVVSESFKGVYDPEGDEGTAYKPGMVYLWNTAAASKVAVTNGGPNAIVLSKKNRQGIEQNQTGFAVYQVPLAMHKQFVATDDNKAAGGFTGGNAKAEDGTDLNFAGFTAFGTGTLATSGDTKGSIKSVAGNVAMKDPTDIKYGAYGTWKIQQDTSAKTKKATSITEVLRNKGCVELFMERN